MKKDMKLTKEKARQMIRKHLISQLPYGIEIQDGVPEGRGGRGAEKLLQP